MEVQAYLNGMAEAASELRRQALDCMRQQLDEAERLLGVMDAVYGLLITIDYPEALTGGLRRTTDSALRAVLHPGRRHHGTGRGAAPPRRRGAGPRPGYSNGVVRRAPDKRGP